MKKYFYFFALTLVYCSAALMHSCKKEQMYPPPPPPPPPPGPEVILGDTISRSFKEEFQNIYADFQIGWQSIGFSESGDGDVAPWGYGTFGAYSKDDTTWYGFSAYSFESSQTEYTYSGAGRIYSNQSFSSWLLTPTLAVKNGDKISFYTRGDTTYNFSDRMQVRIDTTGTIDVGKDWQSVGHFTKTLFDINQTQATGGYPKEWTKYEYTFSGLSGTRYVRVGFRHFVNHPVYARGIGLDQFQFEVN